MDKPDQALEILEEGNKQNPQSATLLTGLIQMYIRLDRHKEAKTLCESRIESNPKNPSTYLSIALLYEGDKDFTNAIEVYERALKKNPNFGFAANKLAFLLCEQANTRANLERALQLAQSSLKLQPGNPAALDTVGWIYYWMDDLNQEQRLIEKALAGAPESAILNYHMGMVHFKNGDLEAASEKLEKALDNEDEFYGRQSAEETLNGLKDQS